jgi:hypothetical protein
MNTIAPYILRTDFATEEAGRDYYAQIVKKTRSDKPSRQRTQQRQKAIGRFSQFVSKPL